MRSSVIICTKDRYKDLADHLVSLCRQTRLPDEIIVVDASEQEAQIVQELLKSYDSVFRKILYLKTQPGLTRQRNRGVEVCEGDIVFFFDDDTVFASDYIEKMMGVFEGDREGRIGGAIGRIQGVTTTKRWGIRWLQNLGHLLLSIRLRDLQGLLGTIDGIAAIFKGQLPGKRSAHD